MTYEMVVFFSATLGSILLGMLVRYAYLKWIQGDEAKLLQSSKLIKYGAVFFTQSLPLVNAFWTIEFVSSRLLLMTGFSFVYAAVSMVAGIKASRICRYDADTSAAFFVCVSFSNVITFGGLAALLLFGQSGYALAMLAVIFSPLVNYGYGYIISHNIARGYTNPFRFSAAAFRRSLIILVPIASILIGLIMRAAPADPPPVVGKLTDVLVPLQAALFGFAFGITLRYRRIWKYKRILLSILAVKYLIVPALVLPVFLLAGLHLIMGGMPIFILILLLYMPVAINALVPPVLYGFDLDLVNTAWLVTTLGLLFLFPLFAYILQ